MKRRAAVTDEPETTPPQTNVAPLRKTSKAAMTRAYPDGDDEVMMSEYVSTEAALQDESLNRLYMLSHKVKVYETATNVSAKKTEEDVAEIERLAERAIKEIEDKKNRDIAERREKHVKLASDNRVNIDDYKRTMDRLLPHLSEAVKASFLAATQPPAQEEQQS